MNVIVEKSFDGSVSVYRETSRHHAVAEVDRQEQGLMRLPSGLLDCECNLDAYADGVYFVLSTGGRDDHEEAL